MNRVNSSMIYLIYIARTFVNATMYPLHNNKNKTKKCTGTGLVGNRKVLSHPHINQAQLCYFWRSDEIRCIRGGMLGRYSLCEGDHLENCTA
jgi:hypothetical protein